MIIFLYGENSYESYQNLKNIKDKYFASNPGSMDVAFLEAKETSFTNFSRQIKTLPFLAKSRLVILKNLFSEGKKDLHEKFCHDLENIPKTTILVIYESSSPDKRLSIFKKVKALSREKEFVMLDNYKLNIWLRALFTKKNIQISTEAIGLIIKFIGNDQWRLESEITKLNIYKMKEKIITEQDINNLIRPKIESNIFNLVDSLAMADSKAAMLELYKLYKNQVYELIIFSMIVRQFRNLLLIKDSLERNYSYKEIEKKTGLHQFVVKKTIMQSEKFSYEQLKRIYKNILNTDFKLKNGEINQKLGLEVLLNSINFSS